MDETGWPPERWALLGEAIARARRAKGWDQQELANKSGNSATTISNYERGRASRSKRIPGGYLRVAQALGWPSDAPREILSGENPDVILSQQSLFNDDPSYPAPDFEELARLRAGLPATSVPTNIGRLSGRDIELTESGYLAQDVFMRQFKRFREIKGLTPEQVVERSRPHGGKLRAADVQKLENGTRLLAMSEASALARALDTSVEWLLGPGFSDDSTDEMRRTPNAEELEAEAKAVLRRLGELGSQVLAARQREQQAQREHHMAQQMLLVTTAHERELERSYQYLLGRIDSLRAASGEPTIMETVPVYEGDPNRAREDGLDDPPS